MVWGRDIESLFKRLLEGFWRYFDNDVLNSDGRRLFEEVARMMVYEHPWIKPLISKARRNPTLDNILKVAEKVLGCEAHQILNTVIIGPYTYRIRTIRDDRSLVGSQLHLKRCSDDRALRDDHAV